MAQPKVIIDPQKKGVQLCCDGNCVELAFPIGGSAPGGGSTGGSGGSQSSGDQGAPSDEHKIYTIVPLFASLAPTILLRERVQDLDGFANACSRLLETWRIPEIEGPYLIVIDLHTKQTDFQMKELQPAFQLSEKASATVLLRLLDYHA
jgi:hypothetical protein